MGVCGGFQMLGESITDREGLEGEKGEFPGLGLLPLKTVIAPNKIARQRIVTSNYPQPGLPVSGYEIHQGRTEMLESDLTQPLFDDESLGIVNTSQSVWGTYLHGIFDNGAWRRAWLNHLRQQRGLRTLPTGIPNYRQHRESLLDCLADTVEKHLDINHILG
jgi:adenosylcobyric acid synthase